MLPGSHTEHAATDAGQEMSRPCCHCSLGDLPGMLPPLPLGSYTGHAAASGAAWDLHLPQAVQAQALNSHLAWEWQESGG